MSPVTLDQIVATSQKALAARERAVPLAELKARLAGMPATRGFARALRGAPQRPAVIAEIKQASPSGGLLRPDFDAEAIARTYQACGARAISVLTEQAHFQGNLARLARLHQVVALPLLQKDFLTAPYQVYEARVHGADAVLLIAAILEDGMLAELAGLAAELGLDVLLEVHDEPELARALKVTTPMLGINHRNLKTYAIDLATSAALIRQMGDRRGDRVIVAESGLRTREDVARVVEGGAQAVLIGETLMRRPDLAIAYQELFGGVVATTH
ncbi:MAG TPA: indole-3-glycerol phosphate synthase TrpC [Oscillatoriaceae cyanobacterium]